MSAQVSPFVRGCGRSVGSLVLGLLGPLACLAQAPPVCATTPHGLKQLLHDPAFALTWEETTMDDGLPLVVSIGEHNDALFVSFTKTTRGLWAEGSGVVCQRGTDAEIQFTRDQIHFGPAASWILKFAFRNGGQFTLTRLGERQMRLSTLGWSGDFVPRDP